METRVATAFNPLDCTVLLPQRSCHSFHPVALIYTSLVTSKTCVAPIKQITIPRLELNGALILAQLLSHCKKLLDLPLSHVFAWTDSTIVLAWLQGNPRRFKVYVGNRVAQIMELVPASC